MFHNQSLESFLIQVCEPLGCSALVLPDGRALHVQYQNLVDIGTLPVCAHLAHQYLHLKDGDMALLNDPLTGGAFLAEVSLIMAVAINPRSGDGADLLIAHRFSLKPDFVVDGTLRERGLHVPPTPIASHGQVNEAIVQAIEMHPDCPPDFGGLFRNAVEKLLKARALVQAVAPALGFDFGKSQMKGYLNDSYRLTQAALAELPSGEHTLQTTLETGERIKLRVELTDEKAIFDFAGTETSKHFHLTNQSTFGVCFAALMATLSSVKPSEPVINAGSFQLVEVHTPTECFLNARAPASLLLGSLVGAPLVAQIILKAIGHIIPRTRRGDNAAAPCLINLEFGPRQHYFDTIAGGIGASATSKGEDALSFWDRSMLRPSIEQLENKLPVVLRTVSARSSSGGLGNNRGGHGMIKTIECLQDGKFHWWSENTKQKPHGAAGAKDGALSEIYVTHPGGERVDLGKFGTIALKKGDHVTVMTAGGGGYEPSAKTPAQT